MCGWETVVKSGFEVYEISVLSKPMISTSSGTLYECEVSTFKISAYLKWQAAT